MPQTAMVLAAGLGTRMRPLTNDCPKPLIKVADMPLIDHTLNRFTRAGVSRAVVNVHYLADQLETHLKQHNGMEIIISDERDELLETGGGLVKARPHLGRDSIFCTNTDAILVDGEGTEACRRLADKFDPGRMDAVLLLVPKERATGYDGKGDFHCTEDGHLKWRNKHNDENAPYIFTGMQILSTDLLDGAPEGPFSTKLLWDKAAAEGRFFGAVHDGWWMHVGDPAGLDEAEAYFRQQ